ncbi:MAG TPA: hypothetical protein PKV66_00525 [Candidatus Pelethenecus sp.]|nr:hypothetical protein [Candidatus Pelethenecus sp.]
MVYNFKSQLSKQMGDTIIAMSSNCTIYGENNCLHIKTNTRHIVFKFDGTPVGWYAYNLKNGNEIYLGDGASPTVEIDGLIIKNPEEFENILSFQEDFLSIDEKSDITTMPVSKDTQTIKNYIEIAKIENWFSNYDRICVEHARCQRLGVECHHDIVELDKLALLNASRLKELKESR